MKICKRNILIKNVMIFIFLSLVYLHIVFSAYKGITILNSYYLSILFSTDKFILYAAILTLLSIFYVSKSSKLLLLFFFFIVLLKSLSILFINFNKLVLILNLMYAIVCSLIYTLWLRELDSAIYNPRYSKSSIINGNNYPISIGILSKHGNLKGYLSNWDEQGCFIIMIKNVDILGEYNIDFCFGDAVFRQKGEIVTKYGQGYGILFKGNYSSIGKMNWYVLYQIIEDRGYKQALI